MLFFAGPDAAPERLELSAHASPAAVSALAGQEGAPTAGMLFLPALRPDAKSHCYSPRRLLVVYLRHGIFNRVYYRKGKRKPA